MNVPCLEENSLTELSWQRAEICCYLGFSLEFLGFFGRGGHLCYRARIGDGDFEVVVDDLNSCCEIGNNFRR